MVYKQLLNRLLVFLLGALQTKWSWGMTREEHTRITKGLWMISGTMITRVPRGRFGWTTTAVLPRVLAEARTRMLTAASLATGISRKARAKPRRILLTKATTARWETIQPLKQMIPRG